MNDFMWECRTKVRFGEGCVREHLPGFAKEFGLSDKKVMIGYGGGSTMDCCKALAVWL